MQGRKISQNIRNKQKLVIERPFGQQRPSKTSNLPKNASVFKWLHNKQNQQDITKHVEHHSLQKKIKPEGLKVRAMHLPRPSTAFSESSKRRSASKYNNDQEEPVDKRRILQQIEYLLNKVENSCRNSVKHQQCELAAKLKKILTFLLEEHYGNNLKLQQLQNRINIIIQKQLFPPQSQQTDSSKVKKSLNIKMQIHAAFSEKVSPLPHQQKYAKKMIRLDIESVKLPQTTKINIEKTLTIHPGIFSYKLYVKKQELESEKAQLVFEHLNQLNSYILNQPNKILHQAFRRHRYLQQELFAYADLLSISRMGANTYIPEINIPQAEKIMDTSLRQLNRDIIQGDFCIQQKCKMLRDFAMDIRHSYEPILDEMIKVIDKKTEQSRNFVFKIVKWHENYITRKEFLSNLKKDYCTAIVSISQRLALLQSDTCSYSSVKGLAMEVQESVAKIGNVFLLGNSFY